MRRQDFPLSEENYYQIRAFEPGRLVINDQEYHQPVIVARRLLIKHWVVPTLDRLTLEALAPAIGLKPDVLLLGTGAKHHFLEAGLQAALLSAGVGIEVMSTQAACRTFNALLLDGRHVVAALMVS